MGRIPSLTFFQPPEGRDASSKFLASFPATPPLYIISMCPFSPWPFSLSLSFSYRPRHSCSLFVACHSRFLRITPRSRAVLSTLAAEGTVEWNERRPSKLILNAEVGHLVYFFINFAGNGPSERDGYPQRNRAFLIKGERISHPSSFIPS